MVAACLGMFILAVLYEGLRVFREWLQQAAIRSDKNKHGWVTDSYSASENGARLLNASENDGNTTVAAFVQIRQKPR